MKPRTFWRSSGSLRPVLTEVLGHSLAQGVGRQLNPKRGRRPIQETTLTSDTILSNSSSGPTRLLPFICIVLAIMVFSASPPAAQNVPELAADVMPTVTITGVTRTKADEVRVHVLLRNETKHDLYIPSYGASRQSTDQMRSIAIYRKDRAKQWVPIGLGSELPIAAVMKLEPQRTIQLDPGLSVSDEAKEGPGQQSYKIKVGYFSNAKDWNKYRQEVQNFSQAHTGGKNHPRPLLKFVDSAEFVVPRNS
jgi:hypothetical protein